MQSLHKKVQGVSYDVEYSLKYVVTIFSLNSGPFVSTMISNRRYGYVDKTLEYYFWYLPPTIFNKHISLEKVCSSLGFHFIYFLYFLSRYTCLKFDRLNL